MLAKKPAKYDLNIDDEGTPQKGQEEEQGPLIVHQMQDSKKNERKRKPVKFIKMEDYQNKEIGLKLLYDEMKKKADKISKKAEMKPDEALKDYILMIKEWSFNLAPKYEFDYFMDRTQVLGKKKEIVTELQQLREYHKGRMALNPLTKQFEEATFQNRPTLTLDAPPRRPAQDPEQPPAQKQLADYNPVEDIERAFERHITEDDLDYKIKKTVKPNFPDEPGRAVLEKMDEESLSVDPHN